ncbi:DUF2024 family protein [Chitinophaga vietnamensis]|uniref:DUF2024 family protein n=1 Tax=Chitinophaga vietnamensis TaxID=2593957 RepID=UPI0011781917|nr:DUF2024 family protein [Chitinophaga vietnamensis]
MLAAVYDTYAKLPGGGFLHFYVIAPAVTEVEAVRAYANEWLQSRPDKGFVSYKDCRFCHTEEMIPRWERDISQRGYHIHELQGCH